METHQINIKERGSQHNFILLVPKHSVQQIAQLFLGTQVEVEATTKEGRFLLEDIRWAA